MTGINSSKENLSRYSINSYVDHLFIFVHSCECDELTSLTRVFPFQDGSLVVVSCIDPATFSWLSGMIFEDVVNSDDLCGMVLELFKYFNGYTCATLLMRNGRRSTLHIDRCSTILIFSL